MLIVTCCFHVCFVRVSSFESMNYSTVLTPRMDILLYPILTVSRLFQCRRAMYTKIYRSRNVHKIEISVHETFIVLDNLFFRAENKHYCLLSWNVPVSINGVK